MKTNASTTNTNKILRWPEVKARIGLSDSTIYRMEADGLFPKRIKISKRLVGWNEEEIETWISDRRCGDWKLSDFLKAPLKV